MDCGGYRERTLYHFKELEIGSLFQSNNIDCVHDKRVCINGSKYRPDYLMKTTFGYLITEVDEHQHKREGYSQEQELQRMRSIYNDIQLVDSGKEVLFIRYNPDEYEGVQMEKPAKQKYLYDIIMSLKDLPRLNIPLGKLILFYDGFDGNTNYSNLETYI